MKFRLLFVSIGIFTLLTLLPLFDQNLHVTVCDVGQGDALVIQTPKKKIYLVDGGPDDSVLSCLGKRTPLFNRSIDGIFISHLHADHIIGLIEITNRYDVNKVIVNKLKQNTPEVIEMQNKITTKNIPVVTLLNDKKLLFDSGIVGQVYYPEHNSWNMESGEWQAYLNDLNDSSQVFSLRMKQSMILFTGDSGGAVLDKIADNPEFLHEVSQSKFRIYKVPHHGSSDGISAKLLDKFQPQLAIISLGKDNLFSHPHKQTIEEFHKRKVRIVRTDINGSIEIITDGAKIWTKLDRKSQ